MRKFAIFVSCLCAGTAFADQAPTSKAYVDNAISTLQDEIAAVNPDTLMTTTSNDGEIAQGAIYDATGNYLEQQSALVTAADANAAVQNAIDSEFVCIEWLDNAPHINENCLIYSVRNTSPWQMLPDGYTPVEYLQGNGSGTINTGVVFNSGTLKYSMEIYTESLVGYTSGGATGEKDVIGNFTSSAVAHGFVAGVYCGPFDGNPKCTKDDAYFFNYVSPKNLRQSSSTNKWHTWETEFANNTMTVALAGNRYSIARTTYHNSSPIVLMGGSESYIPASTRVRIRNIKIWHNGQLVRNYVTCRNSNNVYGVYDLVNNTFTGTTHGTALTGGPDINVYMPMGNS